MVLGIDQLLTNPRVGPNNQSQVNAVNSILELGIGSLALGAGGRSLSGLGSFLSRNLGGGPATPQRQSFVRIPVPVKVRTRAERDAMLAAAAEGEDKEAGLVKLAKLADWAAWLANAGGLLRQPGQQVGALGNIVSGWNKPDLWEKPWAYPAVGAAVGGGLYGGWKLTDYLLDKTKNVEQESELEQARKDYEEALAGRRKMASAGAKPDPLDALADRYEKQAWVNQAVGAGLLGLGAVGLGSGIGAYNWTRSLAEDKAVEEAVKRRQAQIAEQAPSPIMAIPTPVPIYKPRKSHWEHAVAHGQQLAGHGRRLLGYEPEKEKKEKTANVGQAADQFLNRIKSNQMAVWQRLMTPTDGKAAKPAPPAEPAPPQLPTLAGARSHVTG